MTAAATPKIDPRSADDLLRELVKSVPQYFQEWKEGVPTQDEIDDQRDFGMALLKLAARMGEVIIEQLNRVPEKNFLAFLDLLGIDLLPPKSARVPLTFSLAEKAPTDVSVPQGTKVGVAKTAEVIFETEESLIVSRALISRVYSLNPEQDRYSDLRLIAGASSDGVKACFVPDPTWPLVDHVLYVGHKHLFSLAEAAKVPVKITIGLSDGLLGPLQWEYSGKDGWTPAALKPASETDLTLEISGIKEAKVEGYDRDGIQVERSSYWIRAKTTQALPTDPTALPTISSIIASVDIEKADLKCDLAFFNNMPIDLTKDFFPFGERPKFNDTFYIASREAFSKKDAQLSIDVVLSETLTKPDTTSVKLTWEYWDGKNWTELAATTEKGVATASEDDPYGFTDTTNALTKDGEIGFIKCPPIKPIEVNGEGNHWLRIRMVGGDYGKEATYRRETDGSYAYIAATFKPPSLKSLTLHYSYTESVESGFTILVANHFTYEDLSNRLPFNPFVYWTDDTIPHLQQFPALYLGFDNVPSKPVRGMPLSVFFQVFQPRYGQEQNSGGALSPGSLPIVVWRYWDGTEWSRLAVEDETRNFTEAGRVRFIGPGALVERALFGERLFWIKASLEEGAYANPPRLQGIFSNTVWARHGLTLRDQVLGSSNGEPGQLFSFSKAPVLEGQVIEIREPILPSEADTERIIDDEGPHAIRTVKDDAGNIIEVWVRWHEVSTFTLSDSVDRHYVVDRLKGRLLFGDGIRGLIPPPGKDNVKASIYRSGGGVIGNRPSGAITELKTTIPFVASVINHQASSGGFDQERLEGVMIRGPRHIKSRDRAVTVEDYEWLAYQASGEVARTRCLPMTRMAGNVPLMNNPGWVTLIVVPAGEEDEPLPTVGLIKTIKDYLAERSYMTVKSQVDIIGPTYTSISVEASVFPKRIEESKTVEKNVHENLKKFLHPLTGGPSGEGWEFGRDVYVSEIAAVIQGTEGVDGVQEIILKVDGGVGQDKVEIPEHGLPSSGRHIIKSFWR